MIKDNSLRKHCRLSNDRKIRQKFSKTIVDLNITKNIVDTYRRLHTTNAELVFYKGTQNIQNDKPYFEP